MKKLLAVAMVLTTIACNQSKENASTTAAAASSAVSSSTSASTSASAVSSASTASSNQYLVTNESFGQINKTSTLDDLKKIFGEKSITTRKEPMAPDSDEMTTVTVVNAGSKNELIIRWKEGKTNKEIGSIDSRATGSDYISENGVKVGTNLAELEKINGKTITFSGLGWDLGGSITDFGGGKLQHTDKNNFNCRLGSNESNYGTDYPLGDQLYKTSDAKVKKYLNSIIVSEISLMFY